MQLLDIDQKGMRLLEDNSDAVAGNGLDVTGIGSVVAANGSDVTGIGSVVAGRIGTDVDWIRTLLLEDNLDEVAGRVGSGRC